MGLTRAIYDPNKALFGLVRPSTAQLDLLRLINKQPIKPSDVRPTKAQKGPVGHSMAQKMGQLCPVRPSEAY